MKTRNIADSQITISSSQQHSNVRLDGNQCWRANESDKSPWIQVDLLTPKIMSGIVTQGDGNNNRPDWVSSLSVAFTNDTSVHPSWFTFMYDNCTEMVSISNFLDFCQSQTLQ